LIRDKGLDFKIGKVAVLRPEALNGSENKKISWIRQIKIKQKTNPKGKVYHIGRAQIPLKSKENIDWF